MKRGHADRERALAQLARAGQMRIGMEGYARIIATLNDGPKCTTEIQALHPTVSRLTILAIMRQCLRAGIVHRQDWYRPSPHARMVPRWALGDEGDVSMPQYEERARNARRAQSTLILLTTCMQLCAEYPRSRAELQAELKMHQATIERVVRVLRSHRLIYVASWHKPAIGRSVEEFGVGNRRAAPRPARVTDDPDYWRAFAAKQRTSELCHRMAGSVA